jgi:transcriptional regulator with XRE-family HTH domain
MNAQSQGRKKLSSQDARNLRTLLLLNVFEAEVIGERIARARTEAGLTQEELAELIGVSTRSLQGYEAGAVKPYRHMAKLSSTLNRPVAWFLHGSARRSLFANESKGWPISWTGLSGFFAGELARQVRDARREPVDHLPERIEVVSGAEVDNEPVAVSADEEREVADPGADGLLRRAVARDVP